MALPIVNQVVALLHSAEYRVKGVGAFLIVIETDWGVQGGVEDEDSLFKGDGEIMWLCIFTCSTRWSNLDSIHSIREDNYHGYMCMVGNELYLQWIVKFSTLLITPHLTPNPVIIPQTGQELKVLPFKDLSGHAISLVHKYHRRDLARTHKKVLGSSSTSRYTYVGR